MSEQNNSTVLRLMTGEEIICNVVDEYDSGIYINNIAILIPTQENSLGLAPFMPYTDAPIEGVNLKNEAIMFQTKPISDLAEQHRQMFSKIITPPSQGIVTPS